MNHTHVIAFLIGAIAHALLIIWFQWLDSRREIRDARELRRQLEADSIFEKPNERNDMR